MASENAAVSGFLLVKKPAGITSSNCVQKLRRMLGNSTIIGHAGTLDSFATGLLIIGVGRCATREMESIMRLDKQYVATGKLGQLTDTYDIMGTTLQEEKVDTITKADIVNAVGSFKKAYRQVPPIYSALKHNGRNLSDLARTNALTDQELKALVEEKARMISLYCLEVRTFALPFFTLYAHVSHGTYIRSLVEECGIKVGSHATTHSLIRLAIGPFTVQEAIDFYDLHCKAAIAEHLQPVATIVDRARLSISLQPELLNNAPLN